MCMAVCLNVYRLILGIMPLLVKPQLTRNGMSINGRLYSRIPLVKLQKYGFINIVVNQYYAFGSLTDKL